MTANLGALTTTFTPSFGDCFSSIFYGTNSIGDWLQLGVPITTSSCLPENFGRDASLYYSPGICPSGYSYACTRATTSDANDITIATCCPSGYYCQTSIEQSQIFACLSSFPSAATLTVSSFYYIGPGSVDSDTTTVTVTSGETVRGYGPIVRRASSDPSWTNVLPATTGSSIASASASPGSAATGAAATAIGGSSSGLSTGAKAGIGVGVSMGVILIAAACAVGFIFGKRANRRSSADEAAQAGRPKAGGELFGSPVQELSANQTRHELYPSHVQELDDTQRK